MQVSHFFFFNMRIDKIINIELRVIPFRVKPTFCPEKKPIPLSQMAQRSYKYTNIQIRSLIVVQAMLLKI